MDNIIFSKQCILHLYRLGLVVYGKTGKRFHLANQSEVFSLISYCDRSRDPGIGRHYRAFISSNEPRVLIELEDREIIKSNLYH